MKFVSALLFAIIAIILVVPTQGCECINPVPILAQGLCADSYCDPVESAGCCDGHACTKYRDTGYHRHKCMPLAGWVKPSTECICAPEPEKGHCANNYCHIEYQPDCCDGYVCTKTPSSFLEMYSCKPKQLIRSAKSQVLKSLRTALLILDDN